MTRSHTRFPIASRFIAVALCLAAVAVVPIAAGATSKQDVNAADAKVKKYLADVEEARARLDALQQDLNVQTDLVDAAEGKLEETTSQLLVTRKQLDAARPLGSAPAHARNRREAGPTHGRHRSPGSRPP